MKKDQHHLVFVYNANSGLGNAMIDAAHKILNPATYSCSLCQLTYGAVREKTKWKQFREGAPLPMQFLHKDQFARDWGEYGLKKLDFPAILLNTEDELKLMVGASELNAMSSLEELIQRVVAIMEPFQDA